MRGERSFANMSDTRLSFAILSGHHSKTYLISVQGIQGLRIMNEGSVEGFCLNSIFELVNESEVSVGLSVDSYFFVFKISHAPSI